MRQSECLECRCKRSVARRDSAPAIGTAVRAARLGGGWPLAVRQHGFPGATQALDDGGQFRHGSYPQRVGCGGWRAPGASNRLADPTAVFGGLKKSLWKCGVADCRTRFDHMTIADLAPTVGRRSLIVRMLGPQFITTMRTNQEYASTHNTSPKYRLSSNSPPSLMARWFCSLSLPWWKKSLS